MNKEYINCQNCGKVLLDQQKMFCCRVCRYEYGKITLTCIGCGKRFTIKKSISKKREWCSQKCQHLYMNSDTIFTCFRCGKTFTKKKWERTTSWSRAKSKHHTYCSKECKYKKDKSLMKEYICDGCGKKFTAYTHRRKYNIKNYCNAQCYHKKMHLGDIGFIKPKKEYEIFTAKLRASEEYRIWRIRCLERDNGACVKCSSNSDLIIHHKFPIVDFIRKHGLNYLSIINDELFNNIDNGITLCKSCHFTLHRKDNFDG